MSSLRTRECSRLRYAHGSGWVYKPETQALYLKMPQKSEVERVRLYF